MCWKSWRAFTATTIFPIRCRRSPVASIESPDEAKNAKVRETMLALGYDEAISITFISETRSPGDSIEHIAVRHAS